MVEEQVRIDLDVDLYKFKTSLRQTQDVMKETADRLHWSMEKSVSAINKELQSVGKGLEFTSSIEKPIRKFTEEWSKADRKVSAIISKMARKHDYTAKQMSALWEKSMGKWMKQNNMTTYWNDAKKALALYEQAVQSVAKKTAEMEKSARRGKRKTYGSPADVLGKPLDINKIDKWAADAELRRSKGWGRDAALAKNVPDLMQHMDALMREFGKISGKMESLATDYGKETKLSPAKLAEVRAFLAKADAKAAKKAAQETPTITTTAKKAPVASTKKSAAFAYADEMGAALKRARDAGRRISQGLADVAGSIEKASTLLSTGDAAKVVKRQTFQPTLDEIADRRQKYIQKVTHIGPPIANEPKGLKAFEGSLYSGNIDVRIPLKAAEERKMLAGDEALLIEKIRAAKYEINSLDAEAAYKARNRLQLYYKQMETVKAQQRALIPKTTKAISNEMDLRNKLAYNLQDKYNKAIETGRGDEANKWLKQIEALKAFNEQLEIYGKFTRKLTTQKGAMEKFPGWGPENVEKLVGALASGKFGKYPEISYLSKYNTGKALEAAGKTTGYDVATGKEVAGAKQYEKKRLVPSTETLTKLNALGDTVNNLMFKMKLSTAHGEDFWDMLNKINTAATKAGIGVEKAAKGMAAFQEPVKGIKGALKTGKRGRPRTAKVSEYTGPDDAQAARIAQRAIEKKAQQEKVAQARILQLEQERLKNINMSNRDIEKLRQLQAAALSGVEGAGLKTDARVAYEQEVATVRKRIAFYERQIKKRTDSGEVFDNERVYERVRQMRQYVKDMQVWAGSIGVPTANVRAVQDMVAALSQIQTPLQGIRNASPLVRALGEAFNQATMKAQALSKAFNTGVLTVKSREAKKELLLLAQAYADIVMLSQELAATPEYASSAKQIKQIGAAAEQASQQFRNLKINAEGSLKDLPAYTSLAEKRLNELSWSTNGMVKSMSRVISGILISQGFYKLLNMIQTGIGSVITFRKEMENAEVAFSRLLSNRLGASALIRDLQDFAVDYGQDVQDVIKNTKMLMSYGFEAQDVLKMLGPLVDAATIKGDATSLERVAIALGQMKAGGIVRGQEVRQLTEAGIPAVDILADKLGIAAKNINQIGKAAIPAQKAIDALLEGITERFGGAAQELAMTTGGLLKAIASNLQLIVKQFADPGFNMFRNWLRDVAKYIREIRTLGRTLGPGGIFEKLVPDEGLQLQIRSLLGQMATGFKTLGRVLATMKPFLAGILQTFLMIGNAVLPIINTFAAGFAKLMSLFKGGAGIIRGFAVALVGLMIVKNIAFAMSGLFGVAKMGFGPLSILTQMVKRQIASFTLLGEVVGGAKWATALAAQAEKAGTSVSGLTLGVSRLASGFGRFISIAGLVVTAIGAVVAATKWAQIWVGKLTSALGRLFGFKTEEILPVVPQDTSTYGDYIGQVEDLAEGLEEAGAEAKKGADLFVAAFDEVYQVPEPDEESGADLDAGKGDFGGGGFGGLAEGTADMMSGWTLTWDKFMQALSVAVPIILSMLDTIAKGIFQTLGVLFPRIIETLITSFPVVLETIGTFIGMVLYTVANLVNPLITTVLQVLSILVQTIGGFILGVLVPFLLENFTKGKFWETLLLIHAYIGQMIGRQLALLGVDVLSLIVQLFADIISLVMKLSVSWAVAFTYSWKVIGYALEWLFKSIWNATKYNLEHLFTGIVDSFTSFGPIMVQAFKGVWALMTGQKTKEEVTNDLLKTYRELLIMPQTEISAAMKENQTRLNNEFKESFLNPDLYTGAQDWMQGTNALADKIVKATADGLAKELGPTKDKINDYFDELDSTMLLAIENQGGVEEMKTAFAEKLSNWWEGGTKQGVARSLGEIKTSWTDAFGRIIPVVKAGASDISDAWVQYWDTQGNLIWEGTGAELRSIWLEVGKQLGIDMDTMIKALDGIMQEQTPVLKETSQSMTNEIRNGIMMALGVFKPAVVNEMGLISQDIIDKARSTLKTEKGDSEVFVSIGESLMLGLTGGIKNKDADVDKTVIEAAGKVTGGFNTAFGIKSPSTVFTTMGNNIMQGLINGIEAYKNNLKSPINSIIDIFNGMIDSVERGINWMIEALNHLSWDVPDWLSQRTGMKSFGLNISPVSIGNIPHLATGGIVSREQIAMLGERDPEMVAPLTAKGLQPIIQSVVNSLINSGGLGNPASPINYNIGTLVADDRGLRELERRLYPFRVQEALRRV